MTYNEDNISKRILLNMAIQDVMEKKKSSSIENISKNEEIVKAEVNTLYSLFLEIHKEKDLL